MTAGEARLVDDPYYAHKFFRWSLALDQILHQRIQQIGGSSQEQKKSFQPETQGPEDTGYTEGQRYHQSRKTDLRDTDHEAAKPGILPFLQSPRNRHIPGEEICVSCNK